jgi:hypothetical protein
MAGTPLDDAVSAMLEVLGMDPADEQAGEALVAVMSAVSDLSLVPWLLSEEALAPTWLGRALMLRQGTDVSSLTTSTWDFIETHFDLGAPFEYRDGDGRPWLIALEWEKVDELVEVIGCRIRALPDDRGRTERLGADDVRRMPLGRIFTAAKRVHAEFLRSWITVDGEAHDELVAELVEPWTGAGPQRGRRLSLDELRLVADTYQRARETYMPVTEAVAAACNVSRSTAGKRIMAARRAGLIVDTPQPVPNEAEGRASRHGRGTR